MFRCEGVSFSLLICGFLDENWCLGYSFVRAHHLFDEKSDSFTREFLVLGIQLFGHNSCFDLLSSASCDFSPPIR